MSEGLEALKQNRGFIFSFRTKGDFSDYKKNEKIIEKELEEGYRSKQALQILKSYIKPYCIAPNDFGGVRIWLTQDGKHYIDMPQEEYDLLKEVLL